MRCDIGTKSWDAPPKPADCEFDWGPSVRLSDGGATFLCVSDTVLGAGDVLAYGSEIRNGDFTCTSAETGVTCTNSDGSGFTLAKASYRFF